MQVFVEQIKMVKTPHISPKNKANSLLLPLFLGEIWKIFPYFSFAPRILAQSQTLIILEGTTKNLKSSMRREAI